MVIQTCSKVFAALMQMESHASFSAHAINTLLTRDETVAAQPQNTSSPIVSNDRTTLPFQK